MMSVSFFSLMDAMAKQLGTQVNVSQVLWARYFGQLVIVLIICGKRTLPLLRTPHLGLQVFRATMQLGAATCFFIALKHQGLAEATTVADLAPVFITLAAALVLGEKIGVRRILGVLAALVGALIIIRPGSDVFALSSLWPLGTAACIAAFSITTRHIGKTESPLTALLYSALICSAIMSLIAPMAWTQPNTSGTVMMIGVGVIGTLGQLMMIKAYARAPASIVAPFTYAGLITATLWGVLFFDQWPDMWTCIGALVIVTAGLYVWHREVRARPRRT
ncbi:Permease of the drug/metabolite transporter (DMT) superfamily [Pacificibacter marinus]|uniref:Riboflavin transporter n=2 Tax=Pacificibacter marinus TaxID=658057 RepID=A0A1Y5RQL7_9RHOB|nr:Permease of the drug/metabolite transporter (DMT) superfamily [Pacificibacter marinus]SLN20366.1 Riboflavin transporter [Pacificibacter marinus]